MVLRFETRASDSPWVDAVWACTSDEVAEMTSVAAVSWGLLFWVRDGRAYAGISGPETGAGTAPVPEGASSVGIEFAVGTSQREVPAAALVDGGLELPDTTRRTFPPARSPLGSSGVDDAEALVERLVRAGTIVRDPLVTEFRRGHRPAVSARTFERRFRAATGLTQGAVRQIERARRAAVRLAAGARSRMSSRPSATSTSRTWPARYAGTSGDSASTPRGTGGAIGLNLAQPTTS